MSSFGIASYRTESGIAPAIVVDGQIYDLLTAARCLPPALATKVARNLGSLLRNWTEGETALREASDRLIAHIGSKAVAPLTGGESRLTSPVHPERIYCAAANYAAHKKEMGDAGYADKKNSKPYFFPKFGNTVIGPNDIIRMPPETAKLDWEVELAVVIGRGGRRIPEERALDHVAGYTILNDISARDLNKRSDYPFTFDWFQGKCHDTFAPIGPWMIPAWQIPDPQALKLGLKVNGAAMQDDDTGSMVWNVREQIAYLSTIVTLQPGDVIATGTPTGVGAGRGVFLKHGDTVSAWVEGIGVLNNRVAEEGRRLD
jgi:2,4-diketo-3-deoxy-L-fuconate hydrolase